MSESQKSTVELLYAAISAKFNYPRKWEELDPIEQMQIVQGVNLILGVFK